MRQYRTVCAPRSETRLRHLNPPRPAVLLAPPRLGREPQVLGPTVCFLEDGEVGGGRLGALGLTWKLRVPLTQEHIQGFTGSH